MINNPIISHPEYPQTNWLSIEISGICSICAEEGYFNQLINEELIKHYPEFKTNKSWPADHPIWIKYHEIRDKYVIKENLLVFSYDDCTIYICRKHLSEILERMK